MTSRVCWSDERQGERWVTPLSYGLTTRSKIVSPQVGLDTSWSSPLDSQNCCVALPATSVLMELNHSSSCTLKSPTIRACCLLSFVMSSYSSSSCFIIVVSVTEGWVYAHNSVVGLFPGIVPAHVLIVSWGRSRKRYPFRPSI